MKKLGLLSVAAAVALTSSAFASEIKVSGFASVAGVSKKAIATESNEYYDMDAEIDLNIKNDDGVMVKMGWDIYDAPFGKPTSYAGTQTENGATVAPSLKHGYVVAPLGDLTLKTGLVEAGTFGPAAFDTDESFFKLSAAYKVSDMLTIAITDKQVTESGTATKGGGMIGSNADGDSSTMYIDAKIKASGWNVGLRSYTATTDAASGDTDDAVKTAGTDIFVTGSVAGINLAVESVSSKSDADGAEAKTGMYLHGLVNLGNLTTGVAMVSMDKGQGSGTLFDPTKLTDQHFDQLPTTLDTDSDGTVDVADATSVTVIPFIFKINDKTTLNAAYAMGKVVGLSMTEIDATVSYALGKQTTVSATYATMSGDLVDDGTNSGINYMDYKVKVAF